MAVKYTKGQAGYKEKANSKFCVNCKFYYHPTSCLIVQGVVSPTGTCKYWRKK